MLDSAALEQQLCVLSNSVCCRTVGCSQGVAGNQWFITVTEKHTIEHMDCTAISSIDHCMTD